MLSPLPPSWSEVITILFYDAAVCCHESDRNTMNSEFQLYDRIEVGKMAKLFI